MGSQPKPPDPYKTAQAQAGANYTAAQQNAIMGNVNEYTPYGSKTYSQIGWDPVYDSSGKMSYAPRYSSTVQLSPDQQRLQAQQTGAQYNLGNLALGQTARMQDVYGKEMNTSGWQPWQAAAAPGEIRQDQGPTDRAAIEKAMMESRQRQIAPQQAAEDVQLSLRGMSPGGRGFGTIQQGREDAASEAARQAYLGSGQESRAAQEAFNAATTDRYKLGADWAAQLNNLRQGQATEAFATRNQPLNEAMAMMGASGPSTPTFQPFAGPNVQSAPIGQYMYDNYNARAQQAANNTSGMFGLGKSVVGAALPLMLGMSDRRAKQDIEPYGESYAGVPLYWFRYKSDPTVLQVGVMADEVKLIHPDAITVIDGYDHVDYDLLRRRHEHG